MDPLLQSINDLGYQMLGVAVSDDPESINELKRMRLILEKKITALSNVQNSKDKDYKNLYEKFVSVKRDLRSANLTVANLRKQIAELNEETKKLRTEADNSINLSFLDEPMNLSDDDEKEDKEKIKSAEELTTNNPPENDPAENEPAE